MKNKAYASNALAVKYSVISLVCTFGVGQIILWMFPDGTGIGSAILFILMNLIPMLTAGVLSIGYKEDQSIAEFLKRVFCQREKPSAWLMAALVPLIYYGVSLLLQNVSFTGNTFMLGAVKENSYGAVPCIVAHMLIDSLAVIMLVQSSIVPITILIIVEMIFSIVSVSG